MIRHRWTGSPRGGSGESGIYYSFVGVMGANPDPKQVSPFGHCKGTVIGSDSRYPVVADFLESEGRVGRVFLEALKVAAGDLLNRFGQGGKVFPKLGYGAVRYRSLTAPAARARATCSLKNSRRPAAASASICRSQRSSCKSLNHWAISAKSAAGRFWMASLISARLVMATHLLVYCTPIGWELALIHIPTDAAPRRGRGCHPVPFGQPFDSAQGERNPHPAG